MEKKTMDTLRMMVCGELDDIAKKGSLSHESLDVMKDLLQSEHYLNKIEKCQEEKEKEQSMGGSMPMDMGYSQRKYYIDADYQPGAMSYPRGGQSYMDGNSYARGGNSMARGMYDMGGSYADGGNSYMYYDPRYEQPMYSMARGGRGGYSGTDSKAEMVEELKGMMKETSDQTVKTAIQEAITKLNK